MCSVTLSSRALSKYATSAGCSKDAVLDRLAAGQRWCKLCRQWLPADRFGLRNVNELRCDYRCKACVNAMWRRYYAIRAAEKRAPVRVEKPPVELMQRIEAAQRLRRYVNGTAGYDAYEFALSVLGRRDCKFLEARFRNPGKRVEEAQ